MIFALLASVMIDGTRVRHFSNFHVGPKHAKSRVSGYICAIAICFSDIHDWYRLCYRASKEFVYECTYLVSSQADARDHDDKLIETGDCLRYWGKCLFALFAHIRYYFFNSFSHILSNSIIILLKNICKDIHIFLD